MNRPTKKLTFEEQVLASLSRIEKRLGRAELKIAALAATVSVILHIVLK